MMISLVLFITYVGKKLFSDFFMLAKNIFEVSKCVKMEGINFTK